MARRRKVDIDDELGAAMEGVDKAISRVKKVIDTGQPGAESDDENTDNSSKTSTGSNTSGSETPNNSDPSGTS